MIPKKIHYCWVGNAPKPEPVLYCIESWKKYCPDYEIIEWNETNYDFSKNLYMKQAYEAKKWGFVPDYARLDIIYQYGGIYLDTDVEIIKNLDDLLSSKSFFGFEDTGEGEYFVACGLGFGAEANNNLIKLLRDYYDSVNFKNKDGSLNLMPAPRHNSVVFKKYGIKMDNHLQNIEGNVFYPAEFFCPKIFKTGKTKISTNTHSIHHFSASWMDEKIRNEIAHNQAVCLRFGDKRGRFLLKAESVWKKYGLLGSVKKIAVRTYEDMLSFQPLIMAILRKNILSRKNDNYGKNVILFDTALYTQNCGDQIIMENCAKQLKGLVDIDHATHISTHRTPETRDILRASLKIVCGTNLLSCNMRQYGLWKLPENLSGCHNLLLMGVGFDSYNMQSDLYTRLLLKYMLTSKGYHSVRDSFSENCLRKMGIKNVLNTGCPTMWGLTPEHCAKIPSEKASRVVCTITDYHRDYENDKEMLEILCAIYDEVYLWLQGSEDLAYFQELKLEQNIRLIDSSLEKYDAVLESKDLDYVGTRLHAGIRALAFEHRTIVVSIDNRAECISKDTGLPTISRKDIPALLEEQIMQQFETKLELPWENIQKWKNQLENGKQRNVN